MVQRHISFERSLLFHYGAVVTIAALLCSVIIVLAELDFLEALTLLLVSLIPCCYACWRAYQSTIDMFKRIGLQLEALGNEEYNTWHLAGFSSGVVDALKRDTARLTTNMQNRRDAILQQEAVLQGLIEQLAIPVVVFDSHRRVYSANAGFSALVDNSTASLTGHYAHDLGLETSQEGWQFSPSSPLASRFRLYANHIFRGALKLDIVLCFSVEQTLRENEKQVWQKLLRVLNHEVRNSLTPISSIAQSLQHMLTAPESDNDPIALLKVIEKRAQHLLGFVEAYSAFNHIQRPNKQHLNPATLATSIAAYNPRVQVDIAESTALFADEGQLQQALINVIKNADEADVSGGPIQVIIDSDSREHHIRVLDNGSGIQNADNIFVPFYSTKENGNGIGLVLSRELMRQQGGELTLCSRQDEQGAEAILSLPKCQ